MLKRIKASSKPMRYMILGLVIVFGGLIAFNVIKKNLVAYYIKHFEPPAVTVSSVKVGQADWHPNLHAVGEFLAVHGVDVNSEASGNIVAIHFQSGELVKKDQLLVKIDDSVDQATLKAHEANYSFQKINYKRQAQLLHKNATSQSEVDSAQAEMLEAEANVERTKAQIAQKHIETPFAGRLGIRQINLGEYVMPGKTTIVTLQSLDPLFIDFYVPEQYLPHIKVGQNVFIKVESSSNKVFTGKVSAINAKVDTQTHNVKVRTTIPNCPIDVLKEGGTSILYTSKKMPNSIHSEVTCSTEKNNASNVSNYAFIPGMFASIQVEQPAIKKSLVLPATAIAYSLYGNSVFLIEEKTKDGKVQKDKKGKPILIVKRKFIKTGDEQGNQVLISEGLKAGQLVVSAGEVKLENGTRVVINNEVSLNTSKSPHLVNE